MLDASRIRRENVDLERQIVDAVKTVESAETLPPFAEHDDVAELRSSPMPPAMRLDWFGILKRREGRC